MPELRAFRGLRYDPRTVPASAVLCPPYDIISEEERFALEARHPHNAVRLELPRAEPGDERPDAPYRRAAELYRAWQREGVIVRDERPLIYVCEQRYWDGEGREHVCRGFFCLLALEPFGPDSGVRPHERTMSAPKEDRYRLLRAVNANLSPVVLLYSEDPSASGSSARLLAELTDRPADFAGRDGAVLHSVWAVDPARSAAAASLLRLVGAGPLTIADGHHRYETALRYRDECRALAGDAGPADYVLVLLFEARTGGLRVLPTHRVVREAPAGETLVRAARAFFDVIPAAEADELVVAIAEPGRLGLWARDCAAVLEPRRGELEPLLPEGASEALRWLDVTVLGSALPRLVGASSGELIESGRLSYTKDAREAVALVEAGAADAAFLLPPTPIGAVLEIAGGGEVMPEKSTYFYPKAATGLVFNPLAP